MKRGMTLIEVLMAVVIMGIVLVGLLQGMSQSLSVYSLSRQVHTLQKVMDEGNLKYPMKVESDPVSDLLVSPDRSFEDGYSYERTCEDDEDEDSLYLVTTSVKYEAGGGGNELTVVRYVYYKKN